MESDTPRTDEELKRITSMCDGDSDDTCYVMDQLGKHARVLERELAAAKAELAASTAESIDLFKQLVAMRQQRDEARREVCEAIAWDRLRSTGTFDRKRAAIERGWDCFAQQEGGGAC